MRKPSSTEQFTINSAADYLECSRDTIRRLISRGELRAYRYGSSRIIRIDGADLNKLRRPVTSLASYRDDLDAA